MTHTPGEGQPPEDPDRPSGPSGPSGPSDQEQPGYWEQQAQQPPYGEPGYGPPGYGPPYGQPPGYQPPMQYAPDHPRATTVLVLGILGIVVCGVIAPFAWAMGKQTLREIDASNGMLGGRGATNVGYILGIIGTILLGLSLLLVVGMFGLFGMTAVSTNF